MSWPETNKPTQVNNTEKGADSAGAGSAPEQHREEASLEV